VQSAATPCSIQACLSYLPVQRRPTTPPPLPHTHTTKGWSTLHCSQLQPARVVQAAAASGGRDPWPRVSILVCSFHCTTTCICAFLLPLSINDAAASKRAASSWALLRVAWADAAASRAPCTTAVSPKSTSLPTAQCALSLSAARAHACSSNHTAMLSV